ncbi:MAG: alcohol dehydrogenase catalytic domain-containing protein [Alcanivorax sp.]|nr:alcohol dehydrogenase catalytic domain-containing protein [Alcanivorax sp.]
MLALCKTAPTVNGIELREVDVPTPGPGEVLLRVRYAGLCGTDMHIYHWAPRMARRMVLPRVLGHEVCAVVETLGEGVQGIQPGDQVSLESHIYCGNCRQCLLDQKHLCEHTRYPGIDVDGGFAEWLVVPASIVWVNPPGFSPQLSAMMEPFGIAVHACGEGTGVAGQRVLVNGCGPIGLMAVAVARALGAHQVIAADLNPLRLSTAEALGADLCIHPGDQDLVKVVQAATGGEGVDVAIELTGAEAGLFASLAALRRGGDYRLIGAPADPVAIDLTQWLRTGPTIHNIHGRRIWRSWQQAGDLVSGGRVDLSPLVSHVVPLKDGPSAFDLVLQGKAVKPLLAMDV